ncbi:F-box/kelch-repeat protein At3g06240-like isoform X2 [Cornus florida]|uniref:F-box/kelch-repeat protein At3g06240-like isoform X2 n=2 Tax=Cornus florida TaxID=4283 RepID=UPI0028976B65|nr:F-box/kelch-repeat protein At3g06240-like isoform X2 [Cornus florida]
MMICTVKIEVIGMLLFTMRIKRRSCLPNSRSRRNRARAMVGLKNKKKKKAEIIANHKEEEAMPLPFLPEHPVVQILSKLPVKSLLQFKCVSKPWRSLISDPCFIKTHLSQSVTKSVLIATSHPPYRLYTISFGSAGNDIVEAKVEFLFQNIKPHPRCEIIGSCNGLIAMGVESDDIYHKGNYGVSIYVFNLSTRESKEIPDCDSPGGLIGFGYDQCSDDYKLVSARSDSIYVYSLRIGSWRKVHDFPDHFHVVPYGTQLNGALHWLRFRMNNNLDMTLEIAALSLADEKLWKIPLPTSFTKFQLRTCHMGVFEGCLCVLSGCGDAIWVMKEYGVKQSWTKLDIKVPFSHKLEPLGLLRNDEALLLIDYTKLVLYNKRGGTCKDLVIHGIEKEEEIHATIHVDSLLSPFMKI